MKRKQPSDEEHDPPQPAAGGENADQVNPVPQNKRYHGNRKALQLCRQVQRALTYALGDCDDDVLASLYVDSVDPAPNEKHLMVTVSPLDADVSPEDVLVRLQHVYGKLRSEVAASIHRRRVPELTFLCVPPTLPSPGS